jgi:Ion channel regulatory protein UNC-93
MSTLEERYPNIKAVGILSASFFMLFMAFFSSANSASKVLKDCGFANLGFYSLSMLYLNFGLSSLWTPLVVKRLHPKVSMIIASLFYSLWIISLSLTSAALKNETIRGLLSYNAIATMVLGVGFISGAGCSLLWMA